MAKMLIDDGIKVDGTYLIEPVKKNLKEKLKVFKDAEILLFTEKGTPKFYNDLYERNSSQDYVALIGGFQKADFSNEVLNLTKTHISISETPLNAWIVVSRAITYYEIAQNVF
jgi:rRNA pseudouridine-1189 N-methylase Emg1 (Nep1/Mra1 family)